MNQRTLKALEFDKITNILAGYGVTPVGIELCQEIVPSTDYQQVQSMLAETESAVQFVIKCGNPPLFPLKDIRSTLARLAKDGLMSSWDLLGIAETLRLSRQLVSYCADSKDRRNLPVEEDAVDPVEEMISTLFVDKKLENAISSAIIGENEFADDASPELYSIRRKIVDLQTGIRDKLNELIRSSKYSKYMQDTLISMRGDRYVVPVKAENKNEIPGIVHDTSSSGATVFIEPMAVVEADNKIRELRIKEQLEIERILAQLTSMAFGSLTGLMLDVEVLAHIDFVFAKAKFALDYECATPVLNDKGIIDIRRGRHPLIPRDRVVPIDCYLGEKFRVLVITGPNTGGKTVSLKTVGLMQLMTQAGLQIPASHQSRMSVFDTIFADIGDEQSIEQNLSTFSAHMTNIVDILTSIEGRTLVLLDELGSGTDPTEGAGLAMSILEHLNKIGVICMATTHYSELKVFASTTPGIENGCCEFDVKTLQPVYKLLIGIPGKSNAFAISSRLGLWDFLIQRAKEMVTQDELKFEDMLVSIEQNRQEAEEDRTRAAQMLQEAETRMAQLEREIGQLENRRDTIIADAKADARKIVSRAKDEMSDILDETRKLYEDYRNQDFGKAQEALRAKVREQEGHISEAGDYSPVDTGTAPDPSTLKVGQTVKLATLNQMAVIESLPNKNGQVQVRIGSLKTMAKVADLRVVDQPKKVAPQKTVRTPKVAPQPARSMKAATTDARIDIRGEMVLDGIERLDKYLDDALMAGLGSVTVVHGKGTGALRSGIHDFLRRHPRVKSFRLGIAGEGDTGVTIVELK